jgi:hypothetical protein
LGISIFFEFFNSLYPKEINQSIRKTILLIQSFFCFTIIVLPPLYYTKTLSVVLMVAHTWVEDSSPPHYTNLIGSIQSIVVKILHTALTSLTDTSKITWAKEKESIVNFSLTI